jgi:hypothetical protein
MIKRGQHPLAIHDDESAMLESFIQSDISSSWYNCPTPADSYPTFPRHLVNSTVKIIATTIVV